MTNGGIFRDFRAKCYTGFMKKFFAAIPRALASNVSIFIFLFLFIYLVIFGILGLFAKTFAPSSDIQLILGNYTNVTSALGAAIAAGASTKHLSQMKKLNARHAAIKKSVDDLTAHHEDLRKSLESLHEKIDKLAK